MAHRVNRIAKPQIVPSNPRPEQSPPELIHSTTGVLAARSKLGLTGAGVKVGVIDTGVWYKHPALGGCLGKGCRVESGYDFVGDDFTGAESSIPAPDDDPIDDCAERYENSYFFSCPLFFYFFFYFLFFFFFF
jgi:subtilisin family serine protease